MTLSQFNNIVLLYKKHHVMIPLLINQSNISLANVEMSSGFRSSCYWTDWNWANTENIRIGLICQEI